MDSITIIKINKVSSVFEAVSYYEAITSCVEDLVIIDMTNASFIRNNYVSILGMALENLKNENKIVNIEKPNNRKVLNALSDVGFLSKYSDCKMGSDHYKTMIKYTNIPLTNYDEELGNFYSYFNEQLSRKMKNVSPTLLNKLIQKILEMFSNVFRHSESELGLFCSGQFYPKNDRFIITIVDNGISIKKSVNRYLKKKFDKNKTFSEKIKGIKYKNLNSIEAIEWALLENNSSTGRGGYGLKLLVDLITLSDGALEIISNNGFYSIKKNKIQKNIIKDTFDGTIINIELDTDCSTYYYLKGEKNDNKS